MSSSQSQILLHHLSYSVADTVSLFQSISFTFGLQKTGLVGRNGIGKSTFLKLMIGELSPHTGSVQVQGTLAYCPQQTNDLNKTVAQILGVDQQLAALKRIHEGSLDEKDFQIIGEDWLIEDKVSMELAKFGLDHLKLERPMSTLSGGEKTRIHLAKTFMAHADFILLDEPTNNLDIGSKAFLYEAIMNWKKGLIVVSHDRTLLDLMEQIVELNSHGLTLYGGNFTDYEQQKELIRSANQRELLDSKKNLQKTQSSVQSSRERHEKKSSHGRKQFLDGHIDKLSANSKRGRSEKTQSRLLKQKEMMINNATELLNDAKAKIEIVDEIHVNLPLTHVPNGKILLEMEEVTFKFQHQTIINDFNLQITGPERIGIIGNNGSGKTTLIKLILGTLIPEQGKIMRGTERIRYLDQHNNSLKAHLSVLDNFLLFNSKASLMEAHSALAAFLFKNTAALKLVKNLSGGEKLRAELACALMSKIPPQLLILDEPTNHLDLNSINSIESALKHYQGALIVISHDMTFLEKINITRFIKAPFTK